MRTALPSSVDVLSEREREVLVVVALDKTDREIAQRLGIRERTVRAHVSRIILKLGVASRVGAAVAFTEWRARHQTSRCDGSCSG
jgi:DNA-binding NarL/FixJ family response regulator